jgi:hypothetical protein
MLWTNKLMDKKKGEMSFILDKAVGQLQDAKHAKDQVQRVEPFSAFFL